jgi:hypothetical protein
MSSEMRLKITDPILNGQMLLQCNSTHDISHSTRDIELRLAAKLCYGGKATAYLKAIAHVSQKLTCFLRGAHSSGVKRQGREADHSPLFSAEIKNCGTITYVFMA